MAKKQSSIETVDQIMRDICGIKKKKKTRKLSKMAETDIDIFATDEKEQSIEKIIE